MPVGHSDIGRDLIIRHQRLNANNVKRFTQMHCLQLARQMWTIKGKVIFSASLNRSGAIGCNRSKLSANKEKLETLGPCGSSIGY